jgi:hypothetical protein
MLNVVDVIGVASTGAYEGEPSFVTRTKIVRMVRLSLVYRLRMVCIAPGCNMLAEVPANRRGRLLTQGADRVPDRLQLRLQGVEAVEEIDGSIAHYDRTVFG